MRATQDLEEDEELEFLSRCGSMVNNTHALVARAVEIQVTLHTLEQYGTSLPVPVARGWCYQCVDQNVKQGKMSFDREPWRISSMENLDIKVMASTDGRVRDEA